MFGLLLNSFLSTGLIGESLPPSPEPAFKPLWEVDRKEAKVRVDLAAEYVLLNAIDLDAVARGHEEEVGASEREDARHAMRIAAKARVPGEQAAAILGLALRAVAEPVAGEGHRV